MSPTEKVIPEVTSPVRLLLQECDFSGVETMKTDPTIGEIYSDQNNINEWLAELDNTILILQKGSAVDIADLAINPLWSYCESVIRLNRGLAMVVPLGQLPDEAEFSIAITQTVGHIIEASKRVETLRSLMNRSLIDTDDVVSYATKHARSWNGIAVKIFQVFIHMGEAVSFRRLLEVVHMMGYDPDFVAMQLEIEFERIASKVSGMMPATNMLELMTLIPHEGEAGLSGIQSVNKAISEGTTEGTKPATAGDNAGNSEKKLKRKFCDRCKRLKENWFNRIRSGGDIPLQTFLKEFFANPRKENIWNPIRNGEKKPVTWEAMEKKFRANEVDWKPEYTALLSELRGTNGGH
jgi:hypothetical protein